MDIKNQPFFVFDVESYGLHGRGFAVAGGVYINGKCQEEFFFSCPENYENCDEVDRAWLWENVKIPKSLNSHNSEQKVRNAFWRRWMDCCQKYPGILMAGECLWPVEARFVLDCIEDDMAGRKWSGPYPFHEIASFMLAAGMNPMATYSREEEELPAHNPLADSRLSARLLFEALGKIAVDNRD